MILDTSFLVDLLRGDDAVRGLAERLATEPQLVTPVTVMELYEGVHRAEYGTAERDAVTELLEGLTHVDFTDESGKISGRINARLADAGEPIDVEDVMIAAVALERDEPVLTGNPSHFGRVDGLDILTY